MATPRLNMKMVHSTLGVERISCRHGHGKYVDVDGNKYEGEWKDNARQGHGVHIGVTGSYFEGEWARDLRNGPDI